MVELNLSLWHSLFAPLKLLPICPQLKNFTCLEIKRTNCFKMSLVEWGNPKEKL